MATLACCSGCLGCSGVGAAAARPTGVAGSRCVSRTTEPEAGLSVSAVGVPVMPTLGVPDTAVVGVPITRVSDPYSFWYGSGSSILGWIPIKIQGFGDQKLEKNIQLGKKLFFEDKKLQFTYPLPSVKDVQVTDEAFSSQKRHPALQNMKFLNFFYFCGSFWPSGSGSGFQTRIRIHWPDWIRIQCGSGSETLPVTEVGVLITAVGVPVTAVGVPVSSFNVSDEVATAAAVVGNVVGVTGTLQNCFFLMLYFRNTDNNTVLRKKFFLRSDEGIPTRVYIGINNTILAYIRLYDCCY